MDAREKAIEWWRSLGELAKWYIVSNYFVNRTPSSLTGREIEILYNKEHAYLYDKEHGK